MGYLLFFFMRIWNLQGWLIFGVPIDEKYALRYGLDKWHKEELQVIWCNKFYLNENQCCSCSLFHLVLEGECVKCCIICVWAYVSSWLTFSAVFFYFLVPVLFPKAVKHLLYFPIDQIPLSLFSYSFYYY